MEENIKHIDDLFRDQLSDYTEAPEPVVWELLEKRLDSEPGKRRPFPYGWLWYIGMILLLATLSFIVFNRIAYYNIHREDIKRHIKKAQPGKVSERSQAGRQSAESMRADDGAGMETGRIDSPMWADSSHMADNRSMRDVNSSKIKGYETLLTEKKNAAAHAHRYSRTLARHSAAGKKQGRSNESSVDISKYAGKAKQKDKKYALDRTGLTKKHKGTNNNGKAGMNDTALAVKQQKQVSHVKNTRQKNNDARMKDNAGTQLLVKKQDDRNKNNIADITHQSDSGNQVNATPAPAPAKYKDHRLTVKPANVQDTNGMNPAVAGTYKKPKPTSDKAPHAKKHDIKAAGRIMDKQLADNSNVKPHGKKITKAKNTTSGNSKTDVQSQVATAKKTAQLLNANPEKKDYLSMNTYQDVLNNTAGGSGGGGGGETSLPKKRKWLFSFEGGLKLGYEEGFVSEATNKYVIASYLQWNVTRNFSIMVQPAAKYDILSQLTALAGPQTFHNIISNGYTSKDTVIVDSLFGFKYKQWTYTYFQNSDSVRVSYKYAVRNNWEFEIPVVLKYQVAKDFYIYGGVNFLFSNNTTRVITDTATYHTPQSTYAKTYPKELDTIIKPAVPPTPEDPGSFFSYSSPAFSTYKNPYGSGQTSTNLSATGYVFGVTAVVQKRILLDLMLEGRFSNAANTDINKTYYIPYVRLSVGYKLFGK